ncbi:MAG: hypothetical protein FWG68_12750 [Defluviitaleaceae bacterium]|nr:hypothetical protein [Defluviitaleaceae bacterium]
MLKNKEVYVNEFVEANKGIITSIYVLQFSDTHCKVYILYHEEMKTERLNTSMLPRTWTIEHEFEADDVDISRAIEEMRERDMFA